MKIKRISYESESLTHHLVTKKSRKLQVHTSVKLKTKRTAVQFFFNLFTTQIKHSVTMMFCLFVSFVHAALFQSPTKIKHSVTMMFCLFVCLSRFYMQPCSSLSHKALWHDINPPDRLTPNDQHCKLQYNCTTVHICNCPG